MSIFDRVRDENRDLASVLKTKKGIRKIVEELYPDNTHFIYELLQNAEDTGATEASFTLADKVLTFEHNGRSFSEDDIRGICDIGEGTKATDADKIGCFGVGFKAVFAYTETPSIWSPTFSFEISDLVLPTEIQTKPDLGVKTRFEFPFNNHKKPKNVAFEEIQKGLEELAETTLLFLTSLESIHWKISKSSGQILRIAHTENHIEILKQTEGKTISSSHFLRFTKPVKGIEKQNVAIAFVLSRLPNVTHLDTKLPIAKQFRIVSANPGKVAVSFPADKEDSRLRFHLHAPFVPEVSRASLKNTTANEPLFQQLARLAANSLYRIRDLGLLNGDFLEVLPNIHPEEKIPEKYQPIRTAIIDAMNTQPLTPVQPKYKGPMDSALASLRAIAGLGSTQPTTHAPAKYLIQGKASLKDLLTHEDVEFLVEYSDEPPQWAISAAQKNNSADRFLSALSIRQWDVDEFVKQLSKLAGDSWHRPDQKFIEWLSAKSTEWHQYLYSFLFKELSGEGDFSELELAQLVRLGDGTYSIGKKCYFPTDAIKHDPLLPRVSEAVFSSGKSKSQHDDARRFLVAIGVREVGEVEEVQAILDQRYADDDLPVPDDAVHFSDLRRFIALVERDSSNATIFAQYVIFAKDGKFVRDGKPWGKPDDVFLDAPFFETGLGHYYDAIGPDAERSPLSPRYESSGISLAKLQMFAKAVGAQWRLEIEKADCWENPEWNYLVSVGGQNHSTPINRDYQIPGIAKLLARPTTELALLLWRTMCSLPASPDYLKARFQKTKKDGPREADSQLVHTLRESAWVPQEEGGFVKPCEALRERLPSGFTFDTAYDWLKKVKFGEATVHRAEENRKREAVAKELGFSDSGTLERAKKFATLPKDQQERILSESDSRQNEPLGHYAARSNIDGRAKAKRSTSPLEKLAEAFLAPGKTSIPTGSDSPGTVRNPERYRSELERQLRERQHGERPREQRQGLELRRVWEDANPQVREFLSQTYEGKCQITGKTFAKRNGQPYFEVWYLISTHEADWLDEPGNALCVCPEIWARLEYGSRESDPAAVIAQILRWKSAAAGGTDEPILKLKLCGDEVAIRYKETHMERLQVLVAGITPSPTAATPYSESPQPPGPDNAARVIQVEEPVTVAELATLLGRKPFHLIKELMDLGTFAAQKNELSGKDIEKLAARFGFAVRLIRPAVDL